MEFVTPWTCCLLFWNNLSGLLLKVIETIFASYSKAFHNALIWASLTKGSVLLCVCPSYVSIMITSLLYYPELFFNASKREYHLGQQTFRCESEQEDHGVRRYVEQKQWKSPRLFSWSSAAATIRIGEAGKYEAKLDKLNQPTFVWTEIALHAARCSL